MKVKVDLFKFKCYQMAEGHMLGVGKMFGIWFEFESKWIRSKVKNGFERNERKGCKKVVEKSEIL